MRLIAVKPEVLLLFILALTTFALQFSSTILISDFGMMRLMQDADRTTFNVALSPKAADDVGSFLTFAPNLHVTLGEPVLYGEWLSYELEPGEFLNTTFCSSTLNATVSSLSMTGELNQTEPDLSWNATTRSYKVSSLQTLFGANDVHKTPSQREILSITGNIQDPVNPNDLDVNSTSAVGALNASSESFGNGAAAGVWENSVDGSSVGMCDHCHIVGLGISDDIAALFQHIVNTTGRAAVAVDTYLAMLSRSWFYSLLQKFDVPGTVTTAFATTRSSRSSLWFSQLIYKDTLPLLENSRKMKDEDVAEKLDLELEDFLVKIDRLALDDRVSVVKV
ncbi:hypothetical protein E0Z10_g1228 [Xylaria hypoxylon]|uniref:Uncharacterized protein n=1 Tax=Xylaria hypoxylon TaxID=37992 RepID=A0A4Z0YU89_9PEZI|nr:hypothetical protein E0Z10_g1228 [Xylaria hypoxylon]